MIDFAASPTARQREVRLLGGPLAGKTLSFNTLACGELATVTIPLVQVDSHKWICASYAVAGGSSPSKVLVAIYAGKTICDPATWSSLPGA